ETLEELQMSLRKAMSDTRHGVSDEPGIDFPPLRQLAAGNALRTLADREGAIVDASRSLGDVARKMSVVERRLGTARGGEGEAQQQLNMLLAKLDVHASYTPPDQAKQPGRIHFAPVFVSPGTQWAVRAPIESLDKLVAEQHVTSLSRYTKLMHGDITHGTFY